METYPLALVRLDMRKNGTYEGVNIGYEVTFGESIHNRFGGHVSLVNEEGSE